MLHLHSTYVFERPSRFRYHLQLKARAELSFLLQHHLSFTQQSCFASSVQRSTVKSLRRFFHTREAIFFCVTSLRVANHLEALFCNGVSLGRNQQLLTHVRKQTNNRDKKFCITRTFCAPSIAVSYCTSQLGFWCCRAQANLNDDCADSIIIHNRDLLYLAPRSQGNCIGALCCLQAAEKKEERLSSITDIVRPQSLSAIESHLHADHLPITLEKTMLHL